MIVPSRTRGRQHQTAAGHSTGCASNLPNLRLSLTVLFTVVTPALVPVRTAAADWPFVLSFMTLRDLITAEESEGRCLRGEPTLRRERRRAATNHRRVLVWRKADNWRAFTDGFRTAPNPERLPKLTVRHQAVVPSG